MMSKYEQRMDRYKFVDLVNEFKLKCNSKILCGKLPKQFRQIFESLVSLKFRDEPDYTQIQLLLVEVLNEMREDLDFKYDWLVEEGD